MHERSQQHGLSDEPLKKLRKSSSTGRHPRAIVLRKVAAQDAEHRACIQPNQYVGYESGSHRGRCRQSIVTESGRGSCIALLSPLPSPAFRYSPAGELLPGRSESDGAGLSGVRRRRRRRRGRRRCGSECRWSRDCDLAGLAAASGRGADIALAVGDVEDDRLVPHGRYSNGAVQGPGEGVVPGLVVALGETSLRFLPIEDRQEGVA